MLKNNHILINNLNAHNKDYVKSPTVVYLVIHPDSQLSQAYRPRPCCSLLHSSLRSAMSKPHTSRRVTHSILSEKNKTYAAGPGEELKMQNNRSYQAVNKTELAEKMRVKRAIEKFGDRYNSYLASLEALKKLK